MAGHVSGQQGRPIARRGSEGDFETLHFVAVGLDHRVASLDERERLHWSDADTQASVLEELAGAGVSEVVLLCTCNRTDVYAVAADPGPAVAALSAVLARRGAADVAAVRARLYVHVGVDAVATHLFRVASGLEAMVVGETQVLAQVKDAYLRAAAAGTVGKLLHGLFHHALACAKRVHAETALAASPVSVGSAAVDFARRALGTLDGRLAVVLGAGETAETVARRLREAGVARLVVCNRTPGRGAALAARLGGEAQPVEALPQLLAAADVAVCSTASRLPVVTPTLMAAVLPARAGRPLLLLDIAVPRDVDPAVARLPTVRLHNVDDLVAIAAEGRAERAREAESAAAIVAAEVLALSDWLRALDVVPVIRALRTHFEAVGEAETSRALARLGHLSAREQDLVRQMGRGIVSKLLNAPLERLKDLAGAPAGQHTVRALVEAFGLELPPVAALPATPHADAEVG